MLNPKGGSAMTLDIDVKHRGKAFWVKGFLEGDSYSP